MRSTPYFIRMSAPFRSLALSLVVAVPLLAAAQQQPGTSTMDTVKSAAGKVVPLVQKVAPAAVEKITGANNQAQPGSSGQPAGPPAQPAQNGNGSLTTKAVQAVKTLAKSQNKPPATSPQARSPQAASPARPSQPVAPRGNPPPGAPPG